VIEGDARVVTSGAPISQYATSLCFALYVSVGQKRQKAARAFFAPPAKLNREIGCVVVAVSSVRRDSNQARSALPGGSIRRRRRQHRPQPSVSKW
jgi:hypothetical protein